MIHTSGVVAAPLQHLYMHVARPWARGPYVVRGASEHVLVRSKHGLFAALSHDGIDISTVADGADVPTVCEVHHEIYSALPLRGAARHSRVLVELISLIARVRRRLCRCCIVHLHKPTTPAPPPHEQKHLRELSCRKSFEGLV